MNPDTRVAVISAITALITSGLVALGDYSVRAREMDIKMMEIAVGLLKEDPKGPLQPAREWAVDVMSYYSKGGVPLSVDASVALKGHRILVEMMKEISDAISKMKPTTDEQLKKMMELLQRGQSGQAPSQPAPE